MGSEMCIRDSFGMWRSKFKACLSSLGCLYVLKATDNPVMVGDMNVSQEELEQKHSPQVIGMHVWYTVC